MKTKDFEAAVSRLAKETEMSIEPIEVRIRMGQVRWFVCMLDKELLVFDKRGHCYRSCCYIDHIEQDGDIYYDKENFGVKAYGILCHKVITLSLNFDEPCT